MGLFTRSLKQIPGSQIPPDVQAQANKDLINQFSQKVSGPMSMLLGGESKELAKTFNNYLQPLSPYVGMLGMAGIPTYNSGLQNLSQTMQMAKGELDPRDFEKLYTQISESAGDPQSGGYNFNQWSRAIHEMARRGRLNDVLKQPGFTSTDAREVAQKARHYLDSAATMQELNQRGVRDNVRALIESSRNRNINPSRLPTHARRQQINQRWNRPAERRV